MLGNVDTLFVVVSWRFATRAHFSGVGGNFEVPQQSSQKGAPSEHSGWPPAHPFEGMVVAFLVLRVVVSVDSVSSWGVTRQPVVPSPSSLSRPGRDSIVVVGALVPGDASVPSNTRRAPPLWSKE